MHFLNQAAIIWDNLGGNDPEVQMTMAIWACKALHFASFI